MSFTMNDDILRNISPSVETFHCLRLSTLKCDSHYGFPNKNKSVCYKSRWRVHDVYSNFIPICAGHILSLEKIYLLRSMFNQLGNV